MRLADADYRELIRAAIHALDNSHPSNPPNLRFGAAVLAETGTVYASSAFWSDTLSLALHAEHAAIAHAGAHGERRLLAIACVSTEDIEGNRICHPCGLCKQLIYESFRSSHIDTDVVMASLRGTYIAEKISKISPYPWPA
jgi:cytidine deaminase